MASKEMIERAAAFLKIRDETLGPDEASDFEREESAREILDAALPPGEDVGGRKEPELTCPHIDKVIADGNLSAEVLAELEVIRDINSQLRYGLWHEKLAAKEQAAQIASLSAKVAAISDEDTKLQLLFKQEDKLIAAEARASELERKNAGLHDEVQFMRNAAKESRARAERLKKALRSIADWRDHDSRAEDGELEAFARAALQQEGESDA